ncbi:hypothetical protein [Nostoc sp. NMS7]|uniref:hypothetical protein n=1 Tax=Nostoc sp. NMS7 TaxID=2815391 RepID=UPI0025F9E891|nr:hypothetical protein [Nostoc sp. NMS7]
MLRVNFSFNPASSETLARVQCVNVGKPKGINSQMPFNAVGGFVETKTFRLYTGIAGIFHRLGVNDDQCRPVRFFLPVHEQVLSKTLISSSNTPAVRH